MSCWRSFGAAEFLDSCLRGLILLVACIWCRWLFVLDSFFFRPFMASARSLHTFNRGKQLSCNLHAGLSTCRKPQKCWYCSGPVRSPEAVLARKQTRKQTKNNKAKTGKKHTTTKKPKQKRHREVGSPPAMGITCIMRMAQNKKQNRGTTKQTNGPCWWVREATKLHAETRDPPSQDPRDHKEQPYRHDITSRHFEANTDNAGWQREW